MKIKLIILSFILFPVIVCGQQNSKFDSKKLIFGGDIGFGISINYWTLGGSPQIGYKLTDKFHVGAGLGYRYAKSDGNYWSYDIDADGNFIFDPQKSHYTENSLSFNLFAHYYPWKRLILSVRPEIMHTWYKGTFGENEYSENKFVPAFIVGGGVHLKPFILQLNYELIQNDYSPYSDRVFFSIGFMF